MKSLRKGSSLRSWKLSSMRWGMRLSPIRKVQLLHLPLRYAAGLLPRPNLDISLEQSTCNNKMLDLVSSLIDACDTQVAVPAFNGHFAGVAHAALDLHDTVNDSVCHIRAIEFCHARFVPVIHPLVSFPG